MLGTRSGCLDMRVTLREPLGWPRARQTRGVLRPAEYVNWMIDEAHAVSRLVDLMPAEYVDRPSLGSQIDISLKRIATDKRFVAEIKRVEASEDFDASCFDIRHRRFDTPISHLWNGYWRRAE